MFDPTQPVTNPALLTAMDNLRINPNPSTEDVFAAGLRQAHFLLPVNILQKPEPGGKIILEPGANIRFFVIKNNAGASFLPAFTDWEELRKWRVLHGEQTMFMTAADLRGLIMKSPDLSGFVINPYGSNMALARDLLQRLLNGHAPVAVTLGVPSDFPQELADAITAYLDTRDNVARAYLTLMNKEGVFSYLIAVDITSGDIRETFNGIAAAASAHMKQGGRLNMIPLNSPAGADIVKRFLPFYLKRDLL